MACKKVLTTIWILVSLVLLLGCSESTPIPTTDAISIEPDRRPESTSKPALTDITTLCETCGIDARTGRIKITALSSSDWIVQPGESFTVTLGIWNPGDQANLEFVHKSSGTRHSERVGAKNQQFEVPSGYSEHMLLVGPVLNWEADVSSLFEIRIDGEHAGWSWVKYAIRGESKPPIVTRLDSGTIEVYPSGYFYIHSQVANPSPEEFCVFFRYAGGEPVGLQGGILQGVCVAPHSTIVFSLQIGRVGYPVDNTFVDIRIECNGIVLQVVRVDYRIIERPERPSFPDHCFVQ